jgi:UDP-N-acetylmuramoyl-tripeptide--D-alanyl-D-alanine ligase
LFEILWRSYNLFFVALAILWRRLLKGPTVIAITGSRGKTTARECLAQILASEHSLVKTKGNDNGRAGIPRTILRARPSHQYVIVEIGVDRPGVMWRGAVVVKPDIVVVTSVAPEHMENFHTLEAVAREKTRLVQSLGRRGIAVLHGDDPYVRKMADVNSGRTIFFGTGSDCDLRIDQPQWDGSGRLSLCLHSAKQSAVLHTQLLGVHVAPAVAAAIRTAQILGIPLRDAVDRLTPLKPYPARLQPTRLENGAVIVRDEYNGSAGTLDAAFETFSKLSAKRRIAVLSDFTDDPREPEERLGDIGRRVANLFDAAIFVGKNHTHAARGALRGGMPRQHVHGFSELQAVADFLRRELKEGDLVLLKGQCTDHLSRIYFALKGPVDCWTDKCKKRELCDFCTALGPQAIPPQ